MERGWRISDNRLSMRALGPVLLFLFLIPLISNFALAASPPSMQCQDLFAPATFPLQKKLDLLREGDYEIATMGCTHKVSGEMQLRPLNPVVDDPNSIMAAIKFVARPVVTGGWSSVPTEVGSGDVAYYSAARKLYIARTFIDKEFQRNGLTTLVVGAALEMFPETQVITGRLVKDNATRFEEVFNQGSQIHRSKTRTLEEREAKVLEAFRETPFYKTASIYGFTEVDMKASYYRPQMGQAIDRIFIQLRRP